MTLQGHSTIESLNSARLNLNHLFFSRSFRQQRFFSTRKEQCECLIRVKFKNQCSAGFFTKTRSPSRMPGGETFFLFPPPFSFLSFFLQRAKKSDNTRVSVISYSKKRHGSIFPVKWMRRTSFSPGDSWKSIKWVSSRTCWHTCIKAFRSLRVEKPTSTRFTLFDRSANLFSNSLFLLLPKK